MEGRWVYMTKWLLHAARHLWPLQPWVGAWETLAVQHATTLGDQGYSSLPLAAGGTRMWAGGMIGAFPMTDPFTIEKAPGYVSVTFSGLFTFEAAKRSIDTMVEACAKERCTRVLFDCRPMTGPLTVMNRFDVAEYGASVVPASLKVAMLGRADQILPDRFLENVARNRGMRMTLFTDLGEAIAWLAE
jgi:hypothetical protein